MRWGWDEKFNGNKQILLKENGKLGRKFREEIKEFDESTKAAVRIAPKGRFKLRSF